jgi:hypothetical protein
MSSDFGQLCPLFESGVFHEVLFPDVHMTDISICANALIGTLEGLPSQLGDWNFGRTVIVTEAWVKKVSNVASTEQLDLMHHTSMSAVGTVIGTVTLSASITGQPIGAGYIPVTIPVAFTFASSDVLGLIPDSVDTANNGRGDLIIRYKEK